MLHDSRGRFRAGILLDGERDHRALPEDDRSSQSGGTYLAICGDAAIRAVSFEADALFSGVDVDGGHGALSRVIFGVNAQAGALLQVMRSPVIESEVDRHIDWVCLADNEHAEIRLRVGESVTIRLGTAGR